MLVTTVKLIFWYLLLSGINWWGYMDLRLLGSTHKREFLYPVLISRIYLLIPVSYIIWKLMSVLGIVFFLKPLSFAAGCYWIFNWTYHLINDQNLPYKTPFPLLLSISSYNKYALISITLRNKMIKNFKNLK